MQSIGSKKRGTWHIIRVGPFDFETDAVEYQKILRERENVSGEITPRPENPPVEAAPVEEAAPAEEAAHVEEADALRAEPAKEPVAAPEIDSDSDW